MEKRSAKTIERTGLLADLGKPLNFSMCKLVKVIILLLSQNCETLNNVNHIRGFHRHENVLLEGTKTQRYWIFASCYPTSKLKTLEPKSKP